MSMDSVQQFIRMGMQIVAGYLVGQGVFTEEIGTMFVAGIVSIGGVVWWYYWNKARAA